MAVTEDTFKSLDIKEGSLLGCDSRTYGEDGPADMEYLQEDIISEYPNRNPRHAAPTIECVVKVTGGSIESGDTFFAEVDWCTPREAGERKEGNDKFCMNLCPPAFWYLMEKVDV